MLEIIITSIGALIATVIWDLYRRSRNKRTPAEMQKTAYCLTKGVTEEVTAFRSLTDASRAYVSLLHNGSSFGLKGLHYEKLTMVFERTDHLTQPMYGVIKDYPVMQFSPIIAALHTDGRYHRSLHEEPAGSESRVFLEQNLVHDEYMVPIYNNKEIIVGIVGVLFHGERAEWSDELWHELHELSRRIKFSLEEVGESGGSGIISWK